MKPVYMTVTHDPPNSYGDCFRCCVASILEVNVEEVPHPYAGGAVEWEHRYQHMVDYLRNTYGVWLAFTRIHADDLKAVCESMTGYFLLGGRSPRDQHLCVADKNGIAHNPNPLNDGLMPDEDNTYTVGFICRGVK